MLLVNNTAIWTGFSCYSLFGYFMDGCCTLTQLKRLGVENRCNGYVCRAVQSRSKEWGGTADKRTESLCRLLLFVCFLFLGSARLLLLHCFYSQTRRGLTEGLDCKLHILRWWSVAFVEAPKKKKKGTAEFLCFLCFCFFPPLSLWPAETTPSLCKRTSWFTN